MAQAKLNSLCHFHWQCYKILKPLAMYHHIMKYLRCLENLQELELLSTLPWASEFVLVYKWAPANFKLKSNPAMDYSVIQGRLINSMSLNAAEGRIKCKCRLYGLGRLSLEHIKRSHLFVSNLLSELWVYIAVWRWRGRAPSAKARFCIFAAISESPSYRTKSSMYQLYNIPQVPSS